MDRKSYMDHTIPMDSIKRSNSQGYYSPWLNSVTQIHQKKRRKRNSVTQLIIWIINSSEHKNLLSTENGIRCNLIEWLGIQACKKKLKRVIGKYDWLNQVPIVRDFSYSTCWRSIRLRCSLVSSLSKHLRIPISLPLVS